MASLFPFQNFANKGLQNLLLFFLFFDFFSFISKSHSNTLQKENDVIIFIAAHKDFDEVVKNSTVYKIITDDEFTLKNNYSLEIIPTNKNNELYPKRIGYSETSKYYYIWKNYRPLPKYVGFIHYRRYFTFYDNVPNMDEIFSKHDAILRDPGYSEGSLYDTFNDYVFLSDLKEIVDVIIKEKFPSMYETANKVMNNNKGYWCNTFIMKREDFLAYGNFIYTVMLEYDRRHNLKTDEDVKKYVIDNWDKSMTHKIELAYNIRLEGFIIEILTNIFVTYQFKNPLEIEFYRIPDKEHIMKKILKRVIIPLGILLLSYFYIFKFRHRKSSFVKKNESSSDKQNKENEKRTLKTPINN
ncbi:MAG: DUF4422 domain-containing protein [archaeon]|nr:DUF4422 domain-containing protein [archaeon]